MQRTIQFWRITRFDGGYLKFRFPAEQVVAELEVARKGPQPSLHLLRQCRTDCSLCRYLGLPP